MQKHLASDYIFFFNSGNLMFMKNPFPINAGMWQFQCMGPPDLCRRFADEQGDIYCERQKYLPAFPAGLDGR